MSDDRSHKGYWSLMCDGEPASATCSTGIVTVLDTLRRLQEQLPDLFPIPPKAMKFKETDNLLVFTEYYSVEEIKKSAEAIRSNIDYPFIMFFFTKDNPASKNNRVKYKQTPGGKLYEFNVFQDSAGSYWNLISDQTKQTAAADELLPSQVTDRDHIHLPAKKEDFEKVINEKGGKWILHCSDWETLDNLWKNLIRLYITGVLVGLKSCTPKFSINETFKYYHTKALMCYTANADCKSDVRRVAHNIFICTGYAFDMFYKFNKASQDGRFRHEGFTRITKYTLTTSGEMFERDYLGRWKKLFLTKKSLTK